MSSTVAVVDYGMGNLRSVAKAIEHVAPDDRVIVTSSAADIANADRVVVPGQGAMPDCMHELEIRGLREAVVRAASSQPLRLGLKEASSSEATRAPTPCAVYSALLRAAMAASLSSD